MKSTECMQTKWRQAVERAERRIHSADSAAVFSVYAAEVRKVAREGSSVRTAQRVILRAVNQKEANPLLLAADVLFPCISLIFCASTITFRQSQCPRYLRHDRLRPLKHWDREFQSKSRHGCLCAFILHLCCPV
jgi:hypothetical protein